MYRINNAVENYRQKPNKFTNLLSIFYMEKFNEKIMFYYLIYSFNFFKKYFK